MRNLQHLQRVEPLLLGRLDLADDIVVDPEDGGGHLGTPLVPHHRHAALDADHAGPPRLRAHDPRARLYDPASALAAGAPIVVVGVGDERLRGEEAARGEAGTGEGEVAEAREKASRGGRHGGDGSGGGGAELVVRLVMGRAAGWVGVYAAARWVGFSEVGRSGGMAQIGRKAHMATLLLTGLVPLFGVFSLLHFLLSAMMMDAPVHMLLLLNSPSMICLK